jgi:hypothetical protein
MKIAIPAYHEKRQYEDKRHYSYSYIFEVMHLFKFLAKLPIDFNNFKT